MKKLSFILSLVAMFAASALFVGCKNDDIADPGTDKPTPTPPPTHGDYDPNLDGIWLQTATGLVGQYEDPVDIEVANICVMDAAKGVSAFYVHQDGNSQYFELGLYADADSLTLIEGDFLKMMEEALENEGKAIPSYNDLIVPEGCEQWYGKWPYKLVNKDSLVFYDGKYGDLDAYTCYSRLTAAEDEVEAQAKTRGWWSSLKDKLVSAVKTVANKIEEKAKDVIEAIKDAFSPDVHPALKLSMDELNNSRTGKWTYTDWMSKLPDSMQLSHISIPATHDACTASVGVVGHGVNADCQLLSLDRQLETGVRCFDIRPSVIMDTEMYDWVKEVAQKYFKISNFPENVLGVYHGNLSCDITFKEVMRKMKNYLNVHKNETVILRISFENQHIFFWQDYDDAGRIASTRGFHEVLRDKEFVDYIKPYFPTDTLGSARGKILVINYNDHGVAEKDRIGSYAKDGDEQKALKNAKLIRYERMGDVASKKDSCEFWEQNYSTIGYFTDRDRIDLKKKAITDFADRAIEQKDIPLFITQLNANTGNAYLNCCEYAGMFNSYAFQMLWDNMHSDKLRYKGGIYSMDYAGASQYPKITPLTQALIPVYGDRLVWAVIENNFHK